MNKKTICLLVSGVAVLSTVGSVAILSKKNNYFSTKADTTATVLFDGTNNVLDDSVFSTDWTPEGKTYNATTSSGGIAPITCYLTTSAAYNLAFGGDNGVMSFNRNYDNGWRPAFDLYAYGMKTFEMHFDKEVSVEIKAANYTQSVGDIYVSKTDSVKKDFVFDFTTIEQSKNTIMAFVTVYIFGTSATGSGIDEAISLISMSATYDIANCVEYAE